MMKACPFKFCFSGVESIFLGDTSAYKFCSLKLKRHHDKRRYSYVVGNKQLESFRNGNEQKVNRNFWSRGTRKQLYKVALTRIAADYSGYRYNSEDKYTAEAQARFHIALSSNSATDIHMSSSAHSDSSLPNKDVSHARNDTLSGTAGARSKAPDAGLGISDEVSTRVPFLGGWAETFPDVVERGTGAGSPGAAHCRIPFLFGTQRRPAALAVLAPPESTSLYTRIPFLSGSIRPPRNDEAAKGSEEASTAALSSYSSEGRGTSASNLSLQNKTLELSMTDSNAVAIKLSSEDALLRTRRAALEVMRHAGAQAEVDHVVARARRAAAAALDELRLNASPWSTASSRGSFKQNKDDKASWMFDLEADSCQDMIAVNNNRTVTECLAGLENHRRQKYVVLTLE